MKPILAAVALLSCSCATPFRDCLPVANALQSSYNANPDFDDCRWSRVLVMYFESVYLGHAVFVYQDGPYIVARDRAKGVLILTKDETLKQDPNELARLWSPTSTITRAFFNK